MAQFEQHFVQDLTQPIKVRHCGTIVFNADDESNVISVRLFNGSEPVAISGSVVGAVVCSDGATVPLTGSYSGNTASITLTGGCFEVLGQIGVGIQIVNGTQKTTVLKAIYNVETFSTDNVVDPGSRITLSVSDLIDDIETAVASIPADYSDLLAAIAPNYSGLTFPVKAGTFCWYNGALYQAQQGITTSEAWTAAHWASAVLTTSLDEKLADVDDEIGDLKSKFAKLTATDNLFNISSWVATDITVTNDSATATASAFNIAFNGGIPLGFAFKANTAYTLSFEIFTDGATNTGNGLRVNVVYTDTTQIVNAFPNSTTNKTTFSVTTDAAKTISKIAISYGSAGSNVWTISKLQITEGAYATLYNPIDKYYMGIKVGFLGDSYSTFSDWIPEGNATYYPTGTVANVGDTWWYGLIKQLKWSLLLNDSYSGSTISNAVREGEPESSSFVNRALNSFGNTKATSCKPDLIFILGGTNDTAIGTTVGQPKYSDWTEDDLNEVVPAFCYVLNNILQWNPGIKIVNVINTGTNGVGSSIISGMKTACAHYGVANIITSNVDKSNGHPTSTGMKTIMNEVIASLKIM